jgi:hypothetical protein
MRSTIKHPDNPCLQPAADQLAAKAWELLRRNDGFRRVVGKLRALDERAAEMGPATWRSPAHARSAAYVRVVRERFKNIFAADVLEWLVPEPTFRLEAEPPPSASPPATSEPTPADVRIRKGTTPDPEDVEHWRTGPESEVERVFARRRGPHVIQFEGDYDVIGEWRRLSDSGKWFTEDTPWRELPEMFQNQIRFHARQWDGRLRNPFTHDRSDAPKAEELALPDGFSLMGLVRRAREGTLTEVDEITILEFDTLRATHRLFAVPRNVTYKREAAAALDFIRARLHLADREQDLLGTPLEWEVFLVTQDELGEGHDLALALKLAFERICIADGVGTDMESLRVEDQAWEKRRHSWLDSYRRLDSDSSSPGLIQSIFPKFTHLVDAQVPDKE